MAEEETKNLTALEKKWLENEQTKQPSIDDAYDADGQFNPSLIPEEAISRIPRPTGWRVRRTPGAHL